MYYCMSSINIQFQQLPVLFLYFLMQILILLNFNEILFPPIILAKMSNTKFTLTSFKALQGFVCVSIIINALYCYLVIPCNIVHVDRSVVHKEASLNNARYADPAFTNYTFVICSKFSYISDVKKSCSPLIVIAWQASGMGACVKEVALYLQSLHGKLAACGHV